MQQVLHFVVFLSGRLARHKADADRSAQRLGCHLLEHVGDGGLVEKTFRHFRPAVYGQQVVGDAPLCCADVGALVCFEPVLIAFQRNQRCLIFGNASKNSKASDTLCSPHILPDLRQSPSQP